MPLQNLIMQAFLFRSYYDSNYYYKGQNQFIHFTKYDSCKAILKSKEFRLNSLDIMDDKLEVSYLHNIFKYLGLSEYPSSYLKRNLYALSLCNYDVEEKEESLNMWRDYGDNNKGAGLVLEMDLDYSHHWVSHMLSRVYYGNDYLEELKKFSEAYKVFELLMVILKFQELINFSEIFLRTIKLTSMM